MKLEMNLGGNKFIGEGTEDSTIIDGLRLWLAAQQPGEVPGEAVTLRIVPLGVPFNDQGETMQILTDTQQIALAPVFADAKGNPAAVDGVPVWASSNTDVVTVVATPDGLSAVAKAVGPLGTAQISVTADAKIGSEEKLLTGVETIEVRAGEAVSVLITAGEPVEQDAV